MVLAGLSAFIQSKLKSVQSFALPDFFVYLFAVCCWFVFHSLLMKLYYLGHSYFIILILHIPFKILILVLFYLNYFIIGFEKDSTKHRVGS